MKGGVTYVDMEERKRAVEFLRWMEQVAPETVKTWLSVFDQERGKLAEVNPAVGRGR